MAKAQPKKALGKGVKKNTASPALAGKRKEREPSAPAPRGSDDRDDDSNDDNPMTGEQVAGEPVAGEPVAGAAAGSGANTLAQLGAEYADSDDADAEEVASAQRAAPGTVSVRKMDAAGQMEYKAARYAGRKGKLQDKMVATYGLWLKLERVAKNAGSQARGWCCVVCIDSRCVPAHSPCPVF